MSQLPLYLAQAAAEGSAAAGTTGGAYIPWWLIPAMLVPPTFLVVGAIVATRRFDAKRKEQAER